MQAERAVAEPKFQLPPDLVAELQRRGAQPRTELHVEGWKPSLIRRLFGLFGAKQAS
ncbi:MAG TPA: hypothetical protein VME21_07195 [Steroidobacteraceae bacterium]|nr:hypothetical protein [Steroidobacteraceae bacterium]